MTGPPGNTALKEDHLFTLYLCCKLRTITYRINYRSIALVLLICMSISHELRIIWVLNAWKTYAPVEYVYHLACNYFNPTCNLRSQFEGNVYNRNESYYSLCCDKWQCFNLELDYEIAVTSLVLSGVGLELLRLQIHSVDYFVS